jgi:hypothetical protein
MIMINMIAIKNVNIKRKEKEEKIHHHLVLKQNLKSHYEKKVRKINKET